MKMERIIKCFATAIMLCALSTSAIAQSKADLKAVKKEAKVFAKEGWKVTPGYLSIQEQMALSRPILIDQNKWIVREGKSVGTVYDVVQDNAEFVAASNIAKRIEEKINGVEERGGIHEEDSNPLSVAKYKEKANAKYAKEIKHPTTVMRCYRALKDGKIEVLVRLAIRWDEQELIDEIDKELE